MPHERNNLRLAGPIKMHLMPTTSRLTKCAQLLVTASITACASFQQPIHTPSECNHQRFELATRYDSTNWRVLEGDFRIIEVDTVNGRVTDVDLLRLGPPDSATKAQYTPPFQRIRRGRVELDSTPRRMPVLAGAVRFKADQPPVPGWVAYENGYISDPCPPSGICFDWSSTTYRITHVSADGLLGRWDNPMSGNFKLYDPKTKRVLASPSGYFCAIRRAKDLGAI